MPPITEVVEAQEAQEAQQNDAPLDENQDVIEGELATNDEIDDVESVESDVDNIENIDDVIVSIEGEEPPQTEDAKTPQWVKDLRKNQKELQRQNRELQKKLEQAEKSVAPKTEPVGRRPALDDDGINYDTEKYDAAIDAWYKRKTAAEQAEREESTAETARQQAWKKRLEHFDDCKRQLKVQNFPDAEAAVFSSLDVTQQGIIVQGADNPAAIVYALNNHPAKLAELAGMKDPVQFAMAIGKLETKLKMTPRTPAPPPERRLDGSGTGKGGALNNTLEKLRAEAAKTGDYTKVTQFKAEQRKKQG